MRITNRLAAAGWRLLPVAAISGLLAMPLAGDGSKPPGRNSAPLPADARFAPYAADPEHLWNRLHQASSAAPVEGAKPLMWSRLSETRPSRKSWPVPGLSVFPNRWGRSATAAVLTSPGRRYNRGIARLRTS